MTDDQEYFNIQETAEVLGVTRRRIWAMVKAGEIDSLPNPLDRRETLIPRSEIERLRKFARPPKKEVA